MRFIKEEAFMNELVKLEDLRTLSTKTVGEALKRTPTAFELTDIVKKLEDLKARATRGDCPDDVDECDPGNCDVCFMDAVLRIVKGENANKT